MINADTDAYNDHGEGSASRALGYHCPKRNLLLSPTHILPAGPKEVVMCVLAVSGDNGVKRISSNEKLPIAIYMLFYIFLGVEERNKPLTVIS